MASHQNRSPVHWFRMSHRTFGRLHASGCSIKRLRIIFTTWDRSFFPYQRSHQHTSDRLCWFISLRMVVSYNILFSQVLNVYRIILIWKTLYNYSNPIVFNALVSLIVWIVNFRMRIFEFLFHFWLTIHLQTLRFIRIYRPSSTLRAILNAAFSFSLLDPPTVFFHGPSRDDQRNCFIQIKQINRSFFLKRLSDLPYISCNNFDNTVSGNLICLNVYLIGW